MEQSKLQADERGDIVVKVFKPETLKHSIRKEVLGILGHGEVRGNVELGNGLFSSVHMVISGNHAAVLGVLDKSDLSYTVVERKRTRQEDERVSGLETQDA